MLNIETKALLVALNCLFLLVGVFLGVVLFRYSLPRTIVASERIEKCERLGGEYSIYSFSGGYTESCQLRNSEIKL